MIRIAICDDEELFLEKESNIISKLLRKLSYTGYSIDTYRSGKEFVEKNSQDIIYDIIFLDINMDEIDGLETARYIRKKTIKFSWCLLQDLLHMHWKGIR